MSMVLPLIVLLLAGACSANSFVPAAGITSENNYALIRADSLLLAIRTQSYEGSYQELNNRFFPIFIRIKNNGATKVKISSGSLSIIAEGKQFDPIPLEYILLNLRNSAQLHNFYDPFNINDADPNLRTNDKAQELFYELIAKTFSFGDLLGGGMKEGYLFYNRTIAAADSFSIDAMGKNIGFVKK
jgi:hypothetical protein